MFWQNIPLLLILGSLKRSRKDGISFLEITCHLRFVSGYLFFHLILHSLQRNGGIQHLQMPASHWEFRKIDNGIGRCKTHGLSRVNKLLFLLVFVKGGVDFRAVEVVWPTLVESAPCLKAEV